MIRRFLILWCICIPAAALTANQYVGTGSTTTSVDLGASEVAGVLPASKVGTNLTDTQVQNALTISGGSIDNTPIGFYTPSAGIFTTLEATGPITTAASDAASAGLILTPGDAPTFPVDGETWITDLGMYYQADGSTVGPLMGANPTTDFQ